MSEGNASGGQSTLKLGLWLSFAAFLIVVVVFRSNLKEVSFSPNEGMKATMVPDVSSLSESDRKSSEQKLLRQAHNLEQQPPTKVEPTTDANISDPRSEERAFPNLAGNWNSPSGMVYQVTQYGNSVTIREVNPMFGTVTAVAGGQIFGWSFSFPAYTLAGTQGTLSLQVSQDARMMSGQYSDMGTGLTVPMQLSR